MTQKLFITGTDTDCGKTYTTLRLKEFLIAKNYKTQAIKPLSCGSGEEDGFLQYDNYQVKPYWLEMPVSPHIAARAQNVDLSSDKIVQVCNAKVFNKLDYLLIEGAGGLMVPINKTETWIEVLLNLDAKIILVVGVKLGCLNHALLTYNMLKQNNLVCLGWIANCIDPNMVVLEENIDTLKNKLPINYLGKIPFKGKLTKVYLTL